MYLIEIDYLGTIHIEKHFHIECCAKPATAQNPRQLEPRKKIKNEPSDRHCCPTMKCLICYCLLK